jgi:hypothetical protein
MHLHQLINVVVEEVQAVVVRQALRRGLVVEDQEEMVAQ